MIAVNSNKDNNFIPQQGNETDFRKLVNDSACISKNEKLLNIPSHAFYFVRSNNYQELICPTSFSKIITEKNADLIDQEDVSDSDTTDDDYMLVPGRYCFGVAGAGAAATRAPGITFPISNIETCCFLLSPMHNAEKKCQGIKYQIHSCCQGDCNATFIDSGFRLSDTTNPPASSTALLVTTTDLPETDISTENTPNTVETEITIEITTENQTISTLISGSHEQAVWLWPVVGTGSGIAALLMTSISVSLLCYLKYLSGKRARTYNINDFPLK